MGFPRQEYWSGLPLPSPGELPDPGIQTHVSCLAGGFFTVWATREDPQESSVGMYDKVQLHFWSLLTVWCSTLSAPVCFTNKPSNTKVRMLLHLVLVGNSNYLQDAWPYPYPIIPIETPSQSLFPSFPVYLGTFFGTAPLSPEKPQYMSNKPSWWCH